MTSLAGFSEYALNESVEVIDARKQVREILKQKRATNKKGLLICFEGIDGVGKCHAKNTPILMFNGSIKMVQDVLVGDIVMGNDSTPRTVTSLGRGREMMYKVTPKKGDSYIVNESHILSLKLAGKCKAYNKLVDDDGLVNVPVKDYLNFSPCLKKHLLGHRAGVEFASKEVKIDPYFLGLWLGDGTSCKPNITNINKEIIDVVYQEAAGRNLFISKRTKKGANVSTYCLHCGIAGKKNGNNLLNDLRHYSLINNKHIPSDYKTNDRYTRLQMLAGLIDTDGECSHGCMIFTNKILRLAEDVTYLARSLGLAAYIKQCRKKSQNGTWGVYHRVTISGNCHLIPTKIPHKQATRRLINKDVLKVGIKVEPIGVDEYYGFTITGNHLFLLGDFTVVHNTTQVAKLMRYLKDSKYEVEETKWNSSGLLKKPIKKAKEKHMLSPVLYCLLHAADMVVRYENDIVPALNANKIVVSDRYIYTSMARDSARGIDATILEKIYSDIRQPDILFHCVLPIHRAFHRLVKEKDLSYYGVGMDLNLADNMEDSYIKYENLVDKGYRKVLPKVPSYHKLDMGKSIEEIAMEVQRVVKEKTGIGKYKKD